MSDWPIHLIVPLLVLLIVSKKEHHKYILLLLPLAVIPDVDTFVTQHRALLHNMFIPLILLSGYAIKEKRMLFIFASVDIASHVVLDMFAGGVVLFYPIYNGMAFVNTSLKMSQTYQLLWTLDYGFREYGAGWETAYGYISDSIGTGAMMFVFFAGIYIAYRNWQGTR